MINTKEKKKYKCRYVVGTYIQLKSNLQHTFFNQLEEKKKCKGYIDTYTFLYVI